MEHSKTIEYGSWKASPDVLIPRNIYMLQRPVTRRWKIFCLFPLSGAQSSCVRLFTTSLNTQWLWSAVISHFVKPTNINLPRCFSLTGVDFITAKKFWIFLVGNRNTGLFEMIVGVLTTCHTQYTWDRSICFFLFNRTTLQVFVTYLIGALYVVLLNKKKVQCYSKWLSGF